MGVGGALFRTGFKRVYPKYFQFFMGNMGILG
jgi:hypothetical protein